jgi:hypothetical protein
MAATALAAVISLAGFRIVSSSLVFDALVERVVVLLASGEAAFFTYIPVLQPGTTPTKNMNNSLSAY